MNPLWCIKDHGKTPFAVLLFLTVVTVKSPRHNYTRTHLFQENMSQSRNPCNKEHGSIGMIFGYKTAGSSTNTKARYNIFCDL